MSYKLTRRDVVRGLGAGGTAATVAGCLGDANGDDVAGQQGEEPDEDEPDARVGVLQPATGDLGDLGAPIQDAGVLPAIQLEDEGAPYTIDIRREDTETEPEVGIERAQALVDAGYPSITGAAASGVTIPVAADVCIPEEVVLISPASTSPEMTNMDGDYVLRTTPSDALQGAATAQIAYEDLGIESAAVFFLNNDYGQGLNDAFADSFTDLGGDITEQVAFEPEQPSYDSELEIVFADDPDSVYIIAYPDSGEQIFRDYYENFDEGETILADAGLQSHDLPADVDNPMEDVVGTAPAAVGPDRETFDDLYEAEFGVSPTVFTAHAYDATAVHLLAQLRADELTGPAVSEQIREIANPGGEIVTPETLADGLEMAEDGQEIQYHGAASEVVFDENGDLEAASFNVFEFDFDGYTVVDQIDL